MTQNVTVKITHDALQKIADETLQFFECTLNTFDHKLSELYNQNNISLKTIEELFPIGNVYCSCSEVTFEDTTLYIIHNDSEISNNKCITTTTLFSAINNITETFEYECN